MRVEQEDCQNDEFKDRFEESLVFLRSKNKSYTCHVEDDVFAIDLITAVVLWPNQGNIELLLGRNENYSYGFGSHEELVVQHQIGDPVSCNYISGYLIVINEQKVVLTDCLDDFVGSLGKNAFRACLEKYELRAISTLSDSANPKDEIDINVNKFYIGDLDVIVNGLRSSFFYKVAETYGLNYWQWMRFRLNYELPERNEDY